MKRWLGRVLVGLAVCLLLGLDPAKTGRGVGGHPCVAGWGRSVGGWTEPALASPTATRTAGKAAPCQAQTTPSESRALQQPLLPEGGVGPPWLDSRGPPGEVPGPLADLGLPCSPGKREVRIRTHVVWTGDHPQERGFATAFS